MSNWTYTSGGLHKHQDQKKYKENYERVFGKPCEECGMRGGQHKASCSKTDGRSN